MKITDEEREELKELYDAYKNTKDTDILKLLGGLVRTSKWYKNHKLTLKHVDSTIWSLVGLDYSDYYTLLSLKEILDNKCGDLTSWYSIVILEFLQVLINSKSYKLYKPI